MGNVEVVINFEGVKELLGGEEVAGAIAKVANAVAAHASTTAATVDGHKVEVEMRRTSFTSGSPLDDVAPQTGRARAAVLVSHPTPTGRDRGAKALLAALDVGQGVL